MTSKRKKRALKVDAQKLVARLEIEAQYGLPPAPTSKPKTIGRYNFLSDRAARAYVRSVDRGAVKTSATSDTSEK